MKGRIKKIAACLCVVSMVFSMLMTVQAAGTEIVVGNAAFVQADLKETVRIPITLSENTGILGMTLKVSYTYGLTLVEIERGDALSTSTFTPPGNLSSNPFNMVWDNAEADSSDGVLATLVFNVPKDEIKDYQINVYTDDIIDNNLEPVDAEITNGMISVTESGEVEATEVSLNKTSATLFVGGTEELTAKVEPTNASNNVVVWESSNTSVATVEGGVVTGKSAGTAVITAKTADGSKSATCNIRVICFGDVNDDGYVNVQDVIRLLKHVNNSQPLGENVNLGDVNGDGRVNIQDVIHLLKDINNS